MAQRSKEEKPKRGLASADKETRERVARAGGRAHHAERGLEAANKETRVRVARAGGRAPHAERGLQAASMETRERVARSGGKAPHAERGLQAASMETRERVARSGGKAPHAERGLQAASMETRERVARIGGKASRGGGRPAQKESGITFDESAGQCRDSFGRFIECPPNMKQGELADMEEREKKWREEREGNLYREEHFPGR
ncbi:MAG TPA: hypothetical protein VE134_02510 [Methanomicrobiales archaeon]|nr:hypothetical protein [Methanomicrobiales archaeon]